MIRLFFRESAFLAAFLVCANGTFAQWIASPLFPGELSVNSFAVSTNGLTHGGSIGGGTPYPALNAISEPARMAIWTNAGAFAAFSPSTPSHVYTISMDDAGGAAFIDLRQSAALWQLSTGSMTLLHPAGYSASRIVAMDAAQQGGWAIRGGIQVGGVWTGSADTFVELHPSGATMSGIGALAGGRQGGIVSFTSSSAVSFGAALWTGTADSFVNLAPVGSSLSEVSALTNVYEAGYAYFDGVSHAGLWFGSAESFISLHPEDASGSRVTAVAGDFQGGSAGAHAAIWQGSAASYIDLHWVVNASLGASFTQSEILGGALDEVGNPVFVGYAYDPSSGLYQAVVWTTAIPEPAACAAIAGLIVLVAYRRRRGLHP